MFTTTTCSLQCLIHIAVSVTQPSHFDLNETIHFVVANHGGVSFPLLATASVMALHKSVKDICKVNSSIEIQVLGQTIPNQRSNRNQSINNIPILRSFMDDMKVIWGPGYRIPIHVHQSITSEKDMIAYASLSRMFGQSHNYSRSNVIEEDWYRFVLECLKSRSCLIQDLCERFNKLFFCDKNGLVIINLQGQHLSGSIDISKIPRSVQKVLLERNSFRNISGLDHLSGTALRYLDVRGNPLQIDLRQLSISSAGSVHNPLKMLRLNLQQVNRYAMGLHFTDNADGLEARLMDQLIYSRLYQWIKTSVLEVIVIGRNRPKYLHRSGRLLNKKESKWWP